MKRLLWLGVGLAVGALVVRKVTKKAQAYTPRGIATSLSESAGGLVATVRSFVEDVRDGMAEREQEINEAFAEGAAVRGPVRRPAGRSRLGDQRLSGGRRSMKTAEIKRRYLAHFEANGHTVVPCAPLPAINDPNLLFINAGMVQFVPYFLGQRTAAYSRAVSVQKCLRTPDIDEVGKTSRHGTFFQMNGNFSFGDYFKAGAIPLAWDLVTKPVEQGGFGLDPERIWPTVYLDDDEAYRDLAVGRRAGRADRAPRQEGQLLVDGHPRPGGPCSELFYDRGPEYGREGGPEVDEDRYMEFWNLVFMQYEIADVRSKEDFPIVGELPAKNIDTGMGLERMASILQGVDNLYEIDEVRPILARAAELTGKRYGAHSGHVASESHPDDVRLRVIADHVRTALMLIGDGVTPSNEGRGYVLRRIMRRAIRSVRLLGWQDRALPELLPVARDCMAPSYPELARDFERISAVRVRRGGRLPVHPAGRHHDPGHRDRRRPKPPAAPGSPGDKAFQLHDTYGFPIDLTLEIAAEQGLQVDADGFRRLMADQRSRAKADAQARKTGHVDLSAYRAVLDAGGPVEFTGYTEMTRGVPGPGAARDRRCGGRARPVEGDDGRAGARLHPVLRRGRWPAGGHRPDHRGRRAGRGLRRAAADARADRAQGPGGARRGAHRREALRRDRRDPAQGDLPVAHRHPPGAPDHAATSSASRPPRPGR